MSTVSVGLVRDLPAKRVMRAQVGGQDLVVWRATDGNIAAWDNRCPHRGMALSHGFVRGNTLACLYHGWHYGSSGKCSYIPAHPDLDPPATIETTKFHVTEQDGVIWVNLDGPAEPVALPISTMPLRSFHAQAPEQSFWDAVKQVPLNGDTAVALEGPLYQLGELQLVILSNPVDATLTQVTVLAQAGATSADCTRLSRWCEAVRRHASLDRSAAA